MSDTTRWRRFWHPVGVVVRGLFSQWMGAIRSDYEKRDFVSVALLAVLVPLLTILLTFLISIVLIALFVLMLAVALEFLRVALGLVV